MRSDFYNAVRGRTTALIGIALLTACQGPDNSICGIGLAVTPSITTEPKDFLYRRQVAYACVEKWSARLSRGNESVPVVAEAAISACEDDINFAQQERAKALKIALEPTEDYLRFWKRRATFIAVQVRAGNCYQDA